MKHGDRVVGKVGIAQSAKCHHFNSSVRSMHVASARQVQHEHHVRKDAATCELFRGLPGIKDISEDSSERKARAMS